MHPHQRQKIEELYLEMFEKMMAYARSNLDSEALAEEAVQETFRIACQKPEQVCESVNPRGWLVQTLKYTICNIRSGQATARKIVDAYTLKQGEDTVYAEDTVDLCVLYGKIAGTEDFKLLVEMAIEGRSHLEMADARGITVDACKKRVQRAKEALRKKIKI